MTATITNSHSQICCRGRLIDLSTPKVMGIVNVTPDSFYDQSRCNTEEKIISQVRKHLEEGATFIDLGAYSTRPGCEDISPDTECERLGSAMRIIRREFPDAIVSIDTFRAGVALRAIEEFGADIINDISGGMLDPGMLDAVAKTKAPYILMHMKGTPQNMGEHCQYGNMMDEIIKFFATQVEKLKLLGANDIILDPGFGFAKTLDQNYELLQNMDTLRIFGLPILVGVSRKSMIYKLLGGTPQESLNGTTVLNTIAISKGAGILRVHDVKPAMETIQICQKAGF
ncbi:MAG: dihydropteroate synthase [Bacteroidales bacterium]|nr:dihydropteroate synthase [Bacteroidales bacterium]